MKSRKFAAKYFLILCAVLFTSLGVNLTVKAAETQPSGSVSTDRITGQCSYSVQGLSLEQTSSITLQVTGKDKTVLLSKDIPLTAENCTNGIYNGTFSLADVKNTYEELTVTVLINSNGTSTSINAGTCDFSIHTQNITFSITGDKNSGSRSLTLVSTEPANGVLAPGSGNQVSVAAWPKGAKESTAKVIGAKTNVAGTGLVWTADITQAGVNYGTWNAKLILTNTTNTALNVTLAQTTYEVNPVFTSLTTTKTSALEKKKSFGIYLKGLKNPYKVSKVKFDIFNEKGSKVTSVTGTLKNSTGTRYYAEVKLKKLDYSLQKYTVKAIITDVNGSNKTLDATATCNERIQKGTLSVTKKKNATCTYKLTNAYIPGNIKKVEFVIYKVASKNKKLGTYKTTLSSNKKSYTYSMKNEQTGNFKIKAYGYTNWGTKILLNTQTYKLKKKDMGKNGWYYEKYNGKKYYFYYVDNEKQTDLTKIMNLKKSSSTQTNNFYIELNRAACVVTIYMYNDETKKYDIPIKTCTVSVGRDVSTVAGTGGLNSSSSYTPIGNYSICTNGQSVKYTLKTMYEPDGSICYARWATHVVGNVYFHAIAVSAQSHYSLSSSTYNRLGSPASAGCIRMTVADAKWIYDYASTGSTVKIVKGSTSKPGPLGKAATIKTNGVSYDPTDPAVPLSRKKADYKAGRISGYMTASGKKVGY